MAEQTNPTIEHKGLKINLIPSDDLLYLSIYCDPGDFQDKITELELLELLKKESVVEKTLIPNVIAKITKDINNRKTISCVLAKGNRPTPRSLSGRTILLVKPYVKKNLKEEEIIRQGHIRFFDTILTDDIVARIYNELPEEEGFDIYGNTLKSRGKSVNKEKINFDQSSFELRDSLVSDEYKELVALKNGFVTSEGNALTINNKFIIDGNVDIKIGNIEFVGDIEINGSVGCGACVIAFGDIHVTGDCIGHLISQNGSILVGGTIDGEQNTTTVSSLIATEALTSLQNHSSQAQIFAGGSVTALRAQNVSIEAYGDVVIKNEIRNCKINTGGKITSEGLVYAGELYTVLGLEALRIGAASEIETNIFICNSTEFTKDYMKLSNQIAKNKQQIGMIKTCLGRYLDTPDDIQRLKGNYRTHIEQFYQKYTALLTLQNTLLETQKRLRDQTDDTTKVAKIIYRDKLFPGVVIKQDKYIFKSQELNQGPTSIELHPGNKEFTIISL